MAMIIDNSNNDETFLSLKSKYPNLIDFSCHKNILSYKGKNINMGLLQFKLLDESLFNLSAEAIFYALLKEIYAINFPNYSKEQVQYMNYIIAKTQIDNNENNYIKDFTGDYLNEENLCKVYIDENLRNDLKIKSIPINNAYEGENTPGKQLIQGIILKQAETNQQQSQTKGNDKVKTLSRTKGNIVYYDFDPNIADDYNKLAGYANSLLVVIIVCLLGLILGFILIKFLL
jgi:hypothetical protein